MTGQWGACACESWQSAGSSPALAVFQAENIIFAQAGNGFRFDQFQRELGWGGQALNNIRLNAVGRVFWEVLFGGFDGEAFDR